MRSLACNLAQFDPSELERYGRARQAVHATIRDVTELDDGYRLDLGPDAQTVLTAAEWVVLERRCCPFLNFTLEVTDTDTVRLSVTGGDGVKAFIGEALRASVRR
jgi:hypothetical protein